MADQRYLPCEIKKVSSISDPFYDSVVLVTADMNTANIPDGLTKELIHFITNVDKSASECSNPVVIPVDKSLVPSCRVILSSTGPVNRDFDDVRRFGDAGKMGIKRALQAGSIAPLLVTSKCSRFADAQLATILGALHTLYVPLEVREAKPEKKQKARILGVLSEEESSDIVNLAAGIEAGRCVARDVAGSDPERMTSPNTAAYIKEAFGQSGSSVKVHVIEDQSVIEKEYPLMASVNRACRNVPRHQAKLIYLEYIGEGETKETLMFVGKGVTLDTGGTDVKTEGAMIGMSRDKSGAAAVGGIFKVLDSLKPKNLKVMGYMCMVRNSIGSEAYTCDEILTGRSGKRVRIFNTDAEGRLTMVDPLCHMREKALQETNPHIFTIATLTGHAYIAFGEGYSAVMDNGPALKEDSCYKLNKAGENIGDMVEVSRLRREDYDFHSTVSVTEYEDLRQGNTVPSTKTERGHMTPAAFLIMGSRLDEHGIDSEHPIRFSHVDMSGAEGHFPGVPYGAPVTAFSARYILPNL